MDHDVAHRRDRARERGVRRRRDAVDSGDARVPSCPDWIVDDLLRHVGTVQRWAAGMVERRASEPALRVASVDAPADRDALLEWVREGSAGLVAALRATPPDTALWTFPGPGEARFWSRRQAHEIALHRVDAQLAARAGGAADPIDSDLACDGIDEFFEVIAPFRLRDRLVGDGRDVPLPSHRRRRRVARPAHARSVPRSSARTRRATSRCAAARRICCSCCAIARASTRVEVFGDAALLDALARPRRRSDARRREPPDRRFPRRRTPVSCS